ncbi:MAG: hypothetical protein MRY63_09375 [Neomegalonema sp.]|nr:hypothetical protein [Neomegalonema sp.]
MPRFSRLSPALASAILVLGTPVLPQIAQALEPEAPIVESAPATEPTAEPKIEAATDTTAEAAATSAAQPVLEPAAVPVALPVAEPLAECPTLALPEPEPEPALPDSSLIDAKVIAFLREFLDNPIVAVAITEQNARYGSLTSERILALDNQWRAEREAADQPLIAPTLANPLSSYLTRRQVQTAGLVIEVFAVDHNGLNAGQSAVTSDYWQGDEAKFQKTFPMGASAVFVDEAEANDALGIRIAQVSLTIADPRTGDPIGAATFDVNLTELARRRALGLI